MQVTKITLEDNGQDFLELYVSKSGEVVDAKPFQGSIWRGAYIPVDNKDMVKIGDQCPIHNPPHIIYGWLKHKIVRIEQVDYEYQTT